MIGIARREFVKLFRSFRAIMIIAIILYCAYQSAKLTSIRIATGELGLSAGASSTYTAMIYMFMMFFGFLFVFSMSHDTINKEIELQTMRFLVTKTSRTAVYWGKFIGIWLFWCACMLISYVIIAIFAKTFNMGDFFNLMSFMTYVIGVNMILSMVIPKSSLSMFLSIILGLALPFLGLYINDASHRVVRLIRYVMPYYYPQQSGFIRLMPFFIGLAITGLAYLMFRKRDV